jgi:hypothetical protein
MAGLSGSSEGERILFSMYCIKLQMNAFWNVLYSLLVDACLRYFEKFSWIVVYVYCFMRCFVMFRHDSYRCDK